MIDLSSFFQLDENNFSLFLNRLQSAKSVLESRCNPCPV